MSIQINGANGKYDDIVSDNSFRYGRNAVENMNQYIESPIANNIINPAPILDFMPTKEAAESNIEALEAFTNENDRYLNALPPLEFEYRYMPNNNGKVDKKALLGAAYEEMRTKELSVKEFEDRYLDENMSAEALDINKDGKIDLAEYSTTIVAADILSKENPSVDNIDGTINTKGLNAVLELTKKINSAAAANLYANVYNTYNLGSALNEISPE